MQLANTTARYGAVEKTFHWLVALLILANLSLGILATYLPQDTQTEVQSKALAFSLHKTLGIAIFAVALLRILWALAQPRPRDMHPERPGESFVAHVVHWMLYTALVAVPVSGWVEHAASEGFAPILWPFGQALPLVAKSPAVVEVAGATHWLFGKILIGAIALHVLGALRHALERDGTLARMWFGTPAVDVPAMKGTTAGPALLAAAALWVAGGVAVVWISAPEIAGDRAAAEAQAPAGAGNWVAETGRIEIAVAQFGSEVTGGFSDWRADIEFDPEAASGVAGHVRVEIVVSSLRLGSVTEQAMGPQYFNAEAHPTAVFDADIVARGGGYAATGTLDLAGKSAEVALPFTLSAEGDRAEMSGTTTLDRRSFGIGAETTDPATLGFEVGVAIDLAARRAE